MIFSDFFVTQNFQWEAATLIAVEIKRPDTSAKIHKRSAPIDLRKIAITSRNKG